MHKTYLLNGPMKPFNRKPKDLKRDSKGFSDNFYITLKQRKEKAIFTDSDTSFICSIDFLVYLVILIRQYYLLFIYMINISPMHIFIDIFISLIVGFINIIVWIFHKIIIFN